MIKDYRPYYIKKAWYRLQHLYVRHKLSPQLTSLGKHSFIVKPWHIEIFGSPVSIGDNVTLLGCSDKKTRLTVWSDKKNIKGITIGDHVLISPGVRISAANYISIADSCMLASHVYITDSDWHGIYDRSLPPREKNFVVLEENVWVGDSAIICKGVTIGKNSIIGAGSVVTSDVPANVIAAGNPAKIIKQLALDKHIIARKDRFADINKMTQALESAEKEFLKGNTLLGWVRSWLFPKKN
ncbi:MAG: acyltransferase [Desulfobacula sp.]|uniref:acyltransferase n=1 Tax=Desulfobacula sp. TaxID=2593537 RepID=UPI001DB365DA|nr:acyltransferase [Desulfobacula sp.]MBT3486643.1 acyltransferase [Desulfobacula sp.]MBT3806106.1 acyltransferase [Desulfobacula sp.]MBT4026522.1 acyltransferase [Desulfobacula sp.]MBT4200374.1 acyltransferase [Desulfobacula sp.]